MRTITYQDVQIVRMTQEEVNKLSMLCPKYVYFQMETSGSPSCWTNYGEVLMGTSGQTIVRCANEIREKEAECAEYNSHQHQWGNHHNYSAHIKVVF